MQDLTNNTIDYLCQVTGQNWKDRGDALTFSSDTKEKVMSVVEQLRSVGIEPRVKKTKAKEGDVRQIIITKEQIRSLNPGAIPTQPSIAAVHLPVEEKYREKFEKLEKSNKIFDPAEFYSDVPNRFEATECKCIAATMLTSNDRWKTLFNVHANNVTLEGTSVHVICSQAPLEEHEGKFWEAVMDQSALILDLTNAIDRQTNQVQRYFPFEVGQQHSFCEEGITVTCIDEPREMAGEKKLKLHVYHVERSETMGGGEETVRRLHYRGWQDHGAIACKDLSKLINYLRANEQARCGKPLWIHCRAGVGRSGTVAVALALAELFDKGELRLDNYEQKIDQLIQSGRHQRNNWFVQTAEQYKLLHEFAFSLVSTV